MSEHPCAHCHGTLRGYGSINDDLLCHPDDGLDCYRLVTVYHHTRPCRTCVDVRLLEEARRHDGVLAAAGLRAVAEFEREFGPIPAEVIAEIQRKWPA